MRRRRLLRLVVVVAWLTASPAPAFADIFLSPFLGLKFRGATNQLNFDTDSGTRDTKIAIGVSGVVIADAGLGLELEVAHVPRFFEREDPTALNALSSQSGVTTLGGNLLLALPLSVTRESLRPYAVTGLGWMHASANNKIAFNPVNNDYLALTVGVGALGFFSDVTGVRFDVRYVKSVSSADLSVLNPGEVARLSFWRATVGFVLR